MFLPVFEIKDMDFHAITADILITQMAYFTDTEAGEIHDGDHGLLFDVGTGKMHIIDIGNCALLKFPFLMQNKEISRDKLMTVHVSMLFKTPPPGYIG